MGLGSTAKKIQTLADRAEQLYVKLKEVHERVLSVEETVEDTQARVEELEHSLAHQRAVIEALAEERGLDVDEVVAEAAIVDADSDDTNAAGNADDTSAAGSTGDAGGDGSGTDGTTADAN